MPPLQFWFTLSAFLLIAATLFNLLLALWGLSSMVSTLTYRILAVVGILLSLLAWLVVARQEHHASKLEVAAATSQDAIKQIAATLGVPGFESAEQLAAEVLNNEQRRRHALLLQLRTLYIASHDGISSELMSGLAWPPEDWLNEKLEEYGETWRVHASGKDYTVILPN